MKKITRTLWALTIVGATSLTANAQINTIKHKRDKSDSGSTVLYTEWVRSAQKLSATNYLTIGTVTQLPCSTDFEVTFTVANPGTEELTSANINYTVDGFPASYTWEGSLTAGAEETITFTVPNIVTGQHTLSATVAALNGSTEGLPAESYTEAFTINPLILGQAPTITIRITPDIYPDEISWSFGLEGQTPDFESPAYDSDPAVVGIINQSFPVIVGECYVFTIIDEFGDGICCHGNGEGFYELLNSDGTAFYTGGPYTFSDTVSFGITEQPAAVKEYTLNNIKLYPNPATGIINLEVPSGISLPDGYTIYNSLGQVVNKGAVSSYNQQIDVANYAGGVYFVKVDSGTATKTIQFIKG
jgi:Secretion system C-terminal sorting domain/CARDB